MATVPALEQTITIIPAKKPDELRLQTRLLNVAAYCRVSTDQEEQESSYEAQISYYTEKIGKNADWRMAGIFADEGITGTQAKKRPEFLKMIALCRKKKIDLILTKSISRFARNTVDSLKYIRELKSLGISVIFEKENIDTMKADNEMLITLMSCFAQAESESISKNVSWGIRQSFKNGNVPIQYSKLLGYRKGADGKPEIVPEEADIVKDIYRMYLEGASLNQIADCLNEKGLTTKSTGAPYKRANIQSILTNEKYMGDALLQKTYISDCISKKSCKNNGELPKYIVHNNHEAIITHSDFDRVQAEMSRRASKKGFADKLAKTGRGKYSAKYALTELLVCGECGTPYRRITWTAKGFKEIKWRCINRIQHGKKFCHNSPSIDETALHKAIIGAINEYCDVQEDTKQILRESIIEVLDPNRNGSTAAAQDRINELKSNIDELVKLAAVPESAENAVADIERFSAEMTSLREFIEAEKAKQLESEQNTEQLREVLEILDNMEFKLTEFNDVAARCLLKRVTVVDKERVRVAFKDGAEISTNLRK